VEPTGQFLHEIRRVATQGDFFDVCRRYLDHGEPMRLEPYELVLAERDPLAGEHG
jgi:hypothetical protein